MNIGERLNTVLFEYANEIIFVRTDKFNNSGTVRELPYKGIQCFAIYKSDFEKYIEQLELYGGNRKHVKIVDPSGFKIYALSYNDKADKYVFGKSDEVPELEPFNGQKHVLKFKKMPPKTIPTYYAEPYYQIILMN
ncbi:MAG: hypothetical protein NTW30_04820 [Candidatus Aenigmarchaeota archaeon]|nr:hypothetical protein [Candidatus Aenigmarchaeota archaeon]